MHCEVARALDRRHEYLVMATSPASSETVDARGRGESTLPYEPPGIHDALPLMEIGDTVRLRLHVSKTSNRLEPAACELELVTFTESTTATA